MLVRVVADRMILVAVSDEAARHGVREGMTLTQARALHARVVHEPHDPRLDAQGLRALGRWLMRLSPIVQAGGVPLDDAEPPPDRDAIYLDISGSERLLGRPCRIVAEAARLLRALGLQASLAIAPTPGAAWALACVQPSGRGVAVDRDRLLDALAPLPPSALRLDRSTVAALDHLGIAALADLLRLPRDELPRRFGPNLLRRLDQALGRVAEPLVRLTFEPPIQAALGWDGPVQDPQALDAVLRALVERVVAQLQRRGRGARRLDLTLRPLDEAPLRRSIRLTRPSRRAGNLLGLVRCAFEAMQAMQASIREDRLRLDANTDHGFVGAALEVAVHQPLGDAQACFAGAAQDAPGELSDLVERLAARLGRDAVRQARLVESHMPERAWRWVEPTLDPGDLAPAPGPTPPLRLLPRPVELAVMASPAGEDGRCAPLSLSIDAVSRRVVHAVGPRRLGGIWWEGRPRTRDYYEIEEETGRRLWIFRVVETGRWFWHGEFA